MTSTSDVPLSIVRIKRKLNTSTNHGPALASGSAATAGPSSSAASERSGPETLMLAEPSRKRTRINPQQQGQESNPNQPFFTFAETVPVSTFDAEATALRERLKSLASAQEQQQHASVQPSTSAPAFTHTQELLPKMTQKERFKVIRKSRGDAFDMVDVDLDLDAGGRPLPVRKRRKAGNARTRQSEQQEAAEREKMEQFNDLLREYLSFDSTAAFAGLGPHAVQQQSTPGSKAKAEAPGTFAAAAKETEDGSESSDGEYVYDIYYKTTAPPSSQAFIPDSYAEVTGLDASDLENVSTDSDVDDGEVDPDSNDEGFYANDYPDEEDMGGLSENISSDPESDSADEDSDWER